MKPPSFLTGPIARFRQQLSTIRNVSDTDYFSPLQPLPPFAPPGTEPRTFEYPVGYNQQFTPRSTECIGFGDMAFLADNYDLLRIVIEKRKDQVANMPWQIRVKANPGETNKQRLGREATNKNIPKLTEFFSWPDQEHSWKTWLRILLEDLLVFDAPAILVRRFAGSDDVAQLRVIDGSTICRKIDVNGFTPAPPSVAYQQIWMGAILCDLTTDQLVYQPRNQRARKVYGFSPVEQIILTVNIALRRQKFQLNYYTDGSIPDALIFTPSTWTSSQVTEFQQYWDSILSGNLHSRRGVRFLPSFDGKANAIFPKEPLLKDEMDEWLASIVCFAFGVSNKEFKKMVNRATAESSQDSSEEEGAAAYCGWVTDTVNYLLQRVMGHADLEFGFNPSREIDTLKQAQADQIYVNNGTKTRNEVRDAQGLDPRPEVNAGLLTMTTLSGAVPIDTDPTPPPAPGEGGDDPDDNDADPDKSKSPSKPAAKEEKALQAAVAGLLKAAAPAHETASVKEAEELLKTRIGNFLKAEAKRCVERVKGALPIEKAATVLPLIGDDDQDRIISIAQEINWLDLLYATETPLFDAGLAGAHDGLLSVQVDDAQLFSQNNQLAQDYAKDRAAEMVGMKYVEGALVENPNARYAISSTTRDQIRATVTEALSQPTTMADLETAIQNSPAFTEARAQMIAKTEVARAQSEGTLAAWKATGVVLKTKWVLSSLHKCCDECDLNGAAGEIDLGKKYPSGDETAPAHPNCNCAIVAAKIKGIN